MAIVDLEGSGGKSSRAVTITMSRREELCVKGVMHLSECGITSLPDSYVLPPSDRPAAEAQEDEEEEEKSIIISRSRVKLPVVDMARLRDPGQRAAVLDTLDAACREYGFFQVVNHGVGSELTGGVLDVARRFFELPFAERARYMSPDVRAKVRYGTSFNQAKDVVLCWRDFLKLVVCHEEEWPQDLREVASKYARANHTLFVELMEALLQALGVFGGKGLLFCSSSSSSSFSSSQMMTLNCYPACPEPELTLGMPPHSDYGLLTLVLQDHVEGLQVMHNARWLTVDPVPGSFLVNVGDHLEIYSNGRYKSVLHRVLVNSSQLRISVASFHTVPADRTVGPAPELVDGHLNPPRYMDTDFATFLAYIASAEGNHKTFLQSRKLPPPPAAVPSL